MKKILMTGGTGLVGSWLIKDLLKEGYSIRATKRETSTIPEALTDLSNLEWVNVDLLDPLELGKQMEGIDIILHSGAVVSFKKSERKEMYQTNVLGTEIVVDLALEKNIEYFLHVSSVAAVGRSSKQMLMTESSPFEDNKMTSHYSRSKFQAEKEVWRGLSEGLKGSMVNPSVILGPSEWTRSSSKLFNYVNKGRKFFPGGSLNIVDIRDVSKAVSRLLNDRVNGERFILNSGKISYKNFFKRVANELGKPAPSIELSKGFLKMVKWPENMLSRMIGKDPLLTREMINNSFSSHEFSAEKFKNQFGFTFIPVEESIDWACKELVAYNVDK